MPRLARNIFPGIPHHITQRGNRREDIFFSDEDRLIYLKWLEEYCQKHKVEVLAYCLMTNHIHLILKPDNTEGLQRVLKPLHMRYAQRVNKANGWKGHLWQGRYFSSALDEAYTWSAIRYVERNPVRTGMVTQAEDYLWSSAAAHCGLKTNKLITKLADIKRAVPEQEWSAWLALTGDEDSINILRRNVEKGLPCGDDGFIGKLEKLSGRKLKYRPQGRPAIKG